MTQEQKQTKAAAGPLPGREPTVRQAPVIHVVDDDESFQTAVSRLLRAAGYVVRAYSNAGDFLLGHPDAVPGCVLLDVRMPGPSGLDLQAALTMRAEPLPIIFLTGYGDIPSTVRAMKAGAVDFLTKPVKREALLSSIQLALERDAEQRLVRERLRRWRSCYETLTARELEVFAGVVAGRMNKAIASDLGVAERTVKAHRAKVMEKMHVASVAELVRIADQLRASGIVTRPPSSGV